MNFKNFSLKLGFETKKIINEYFSGNNLVEKVQKLLNAVVSFQSQENGF